VNVSGLGPFRAGRADALRARALEEATYGWLILQGAPDFASWKSL